MLKPTVVIVDDDEDNVLVLEAALEVAGFDVKIARSLREARSVLESAPADALVTDYALGDGTAVDLLVGLGARRPHVAILVSGYGSPEDVARSREVGFDAHFVKPLEFKQLERTLRSALAAPGVSDRASSNPPERP
jgi:DNA-binding response OmpR family regulator